MRTPPSRPPGLPNRSAPPTCVRWRGSWPAGRSRSVLVKLVDHFQYGLNSPICLTWELTYACNLTCAHCLSSSGRRDPRELSTAEAKAVIDELQRMQAFS